ncbi:MAG TPA: hypothetical protein GX499_01105 [Clostridiales bacterium]|nr:hypothetical protein [Clostridiales bacterium]
MGKYLFRYLIFWLPAAVAAYFFSGGSSTATLAFQWFGAFFMVLGWSVNTGMMAYHHPRQGLALLLAWLGVNILIITALYRTSYQSSLHWFLLNVGGVLSFKPLDIFIVALLDFPFQHELIVTCTLAACCFFGWICGTLYRRIRPNPYRPKIYRIG